MCPGRVLAAATRAGLQENGATMETSRYVAEPLETERLNTKRPVCQSYQLTGASQNSLAVAALVKSWGLM